MIYILSSIKSFLLLIIYIMIIILLLIARVVKISDVKDLFIESKNELIKSIHGFGFLSITTVITLTVIYSI